jgi:hypothetical protein
MAKIEIKWIAIAAVIATVLAWFTVVVVQQINASLAEAKKDVEEKRAEVGDAFKRAEDGVGDAFKRAEDEAGDAVKWTEDEAAHGLGELKSGISGVSRRLHVRDLPFPKGSQTD